MRVWSWRLRAAVLILAVVATTSCGNDAGDGDLRQNEETGSPTTTAVDRSQYPMLGVMVLYTVGGLGLLLGG